jgi:hypothetical protein
LEKPKSMSLHLKTIILPDAGKEVFLFLGNLLVLEEKGELAEIENFLALKSGLVLAVLLIIGHKVREIIDFFIEEQLETFSAFENQEHYDLLKEIKLQKKLEIMVLNKLATIPDLHSLYLMTGKKIFNYVVTASHELIEFNNESNSNISVKELISLNLTNFSKTKNFFLDKELVEPATFKPLKLFPEILVEPILALSYKPKFKKNSECLIYYYYLLIEEELKSTKLQVNFLENSVDLEVSGANSDLRGYFLAKGIFNANKFLMGFEGTGWIIIS